MIPRFLNFFRTGSLSYALSPITLFGRVLGLPGPVLGTLISGVSLSRRVTSAGEAESVWLPRGIPLPSTTTMHFVPFPLLVFPTPAPLFLPGKKLASMNTSSQSSTPLASSSERKALHISFRTSASYHSFRRRQQVEGCGYLSGRSFHRAPVLSTQSIPSNTSRSSALGRPPFGPTGFLGIRGSIFSHCSSRQIHYTFTHRHLPPVSYIYINYWKNNYLIHSRYRAVNTHARFCNHF